MSGREDARAFAALAAVQVLFGSWPIAGKVAFAYLPPLALAAARTVGAALVLALLHRLFARPLDFAAHRWSVVALALLGVVLNQAMFTIGLSLTDPLHATLLITTIPVFTYGIAVATGRESVGPRRAAGIGLAFAGAVFIVGLGRLEGGAQQMLGNLLVLLNSLSFAAFLVFSKPLNETLGPYAVTAAVFAAGALIMLPVGLATDTGAHLAAMPAVGWAVFAYIVLGPTVGTYVLNATALRRVPASTVAVFIHLQPIVTALLAWWLLQDAPSVRVLPAAALVLAGLWLVARRRPKVLRGAAVTD